MKREAHRQAREPKVAVIREEFIALTKDPLVAVVLNQLVYWTQRVKDFDFFLQEEQSLNPACNVTPRHGWIYKTAEDLIEETMLQVSKSTMLRYLSVLLTAGWIDKRTNASDKWDKTTQYRVNLRKLQEDLLELGYTLPGSGALMQTAKAPYSLESAETPRFQNETSRFENETSRFQNETSKFQNRTSNTEITTETIAEITNKEHSASHARGSASEEDLEALVISPEQIPQKMLEFWKTHVGQDEVFLTEARKSQLTTLLQRFLGNDFLQWEKFCTKIKASRFLMGEGARKWRVSLDWILLEANVRKVLEGNYDNPQDAEDSSQVRALGLSLPQKKQIQAILQKIEDPTWRQFCSHLPFNSRLSSYVPLWQLEEIVNARFLGLEDERLVWIACQNNHILSRIGNLRFQLLSAIQKTYPQVSAVRTCLEGENPSLSSTTTSLGDTVNEN